MNRFQNPRLTATAQVLREKMTKEERHLWYDFLKQLPVTCNRQKVIGPYIVDFYCAKAKLVIELDGSQHFSQSGIRQDRERDDFLREQGLTVVHYSNADVNLRFQAVCEDIIRRLPLEGKLSPQVTDEVATEGGIG